MTWLIDTAVVTGVLIALVLVLRGPVARRFGPGMAYALWALPMLRLVLPPLVLPAQSASPLETVTVFSAVAQSPLVATPPAPAWSDVAPALQVVWLAGALAFLAWRAWSYVAMRRSLLAEACQVGESGRVRLIETPALASPVAFGIFDKVVALPMDFMNRADRAGRDLAIAHELEHHAARDLAVNLAMQPLLALHWFNPLAWLGWRAMRRDQEAACDARVLAGRDSAARESYARLITSFVHSPRLALAAPMSCPVLGEKSIVHRLRSLTMTQPDPKGRLLGRLLLGAAVLALPLTASVTYAAQDAPAPPAPPAAPVDPAIKKTTKITIIDNPGGSTIDDKSLHTRVIERGDHTIVLKTKQPLSDAEAAQHVAKAEASMADAQVFTMSADHDAHSHNSHEMVLVSTDEDNANAKAGKREVRTVMVSHNGDGKAMTFSTAPSFASCSDGKPITANAETNEGGKREVSRVVLCSKGGDMSQALTGLRQAREGVAKNSNLSDKAKTEILQQLDAEIAKLSK